jgi:hypothetical protein
MANTYTLISSVTVGSGGSTSIAFSSIPSTYTDLHLVISARTDRSSVVDYLRIRFNSDTGSNYSYKGVISYSGIVDGAISGSSLTSVQGLVLNGDTSTSNTFCNNSLYIPNYTSSNNKSLSYETVLENNSTTNYEFGSYAGLWGQTSAITSINLFTVNTNNFKQYSTAYLYGISNA